MHVDYSRVRSDFIRPKFWAWRDSSILDHALVVQLIVRICSGTLINYLSKSEQLITNYLSKPEQLITAMVWIINCSSGWSRSRCGQSGPVVQIDTTPVWVSGSANAMNNSSWQHRELICLILYALVFYVIVIRRSLHLSHGTISSLSIVKQLNTCVCVYIYIYCVFVLISSLPLSFPRFVHGYVCCL